MRNRRDKTERIRRVRALIHEIEEFRLARVDHARQAVADDQRSLIDSLHGDGPMQGLFVDAMSRRLTALARRRDALARERQAQEERLTEAGRQLKLAERAAKSASRAEREEERRRAFERLLQAINPE